jgi:F-type H+-transporting ATPase subunit delta
MKDKIIAKIYAETFIELAKDTSFEIATELTKVTEVINVSNELENVLFLDVFTTEEKINVFSDIAAKISLNAVLTNAIKYLINEKRIALLPLIYKEIIVIDDYEKGFLRGTIEGYSESISDAHKAKLINAMKNEIGNKEAILDYKQNPEITAGFKVTVGDYQLDATVDNQLNSFRDSVLER